MAGTNVNAAGGIILYRVDPGRNMHRYYRLAVQVDLFGRWSFLSEWGRIGSPGRVRILTFESGAEANEALNRRRRAKERRGYAMAVA